jgi:hypothetical protein
MTVSTQALSINPRLRNCVDGLFAVKSQQFRNDCCRCDFDENDVIETSTVEGIKEGETALDLVGFDHGGEYVVDRKRGTLASEVVGDGEDSTEIVRRVAPFSSKETVVKVKPTNDSANVERASDRVELVVSSGNLGTVRNNSSFNYRSKKFGALRETQPLEATTNGIDKTKTSRLIRERGVDLVVMDIVRDILENLVGVRTNGRLSVVRRHVTGV